MIRLTATFRDYVQQQSKKNDFYTKLRWSYQTKQIGTFCQILLRKNDVGFIFPQLNLAKCSGHNMMFRIPQILSIISSYKSTQSLWVFIKNHHGPVVITSGYVIVITGFINETWRSLKSHFSSFIIITSVSIKMRK